MPKEFYCLPVGIHDDKRVQKLNEQHNGHGLTCFHFIYWQCLKDGSYYITAPENVCNWLNINLYAHDWKPVLLSMYNLGLLSLKMGKDHKIITSTDIQQAFKAAHPRKPIKPEYCLIETVETKSNAIHAEDIKAAISKEKTAFQQELEQYIPRYGAEMIKAFYNYWSELTQDRKKMRFQQQKTWETPKRLATWANNNKK